MTDQEILQLRCAKAEKVLSDCSAALELIPIWAIEKGQQWLPSEIALLLLKRAKDSVADYILVHGNIENNI